MNKSNLRNAKVLIVDDKQSNIDVLEDLLVESEFKSIRSTSDSRLVVEII
jgi:CheY-like chemotaxis protein